MRTGFIDEFHEKFYMMKFRESNRLLEFIKANSDSLFTKGTIEAKEFYSSYTSIIFNSQSIKLDSFFRHNLELIAKALRLNKDGRLLPNIRLLDKVRCEYAYTPDSFPGYESKYVNYLFCYAYYYNLSSNTLRSLIEYFMNNSFQILEWASLNGVIKPFSPFADKQVKLIDEDCYFEVTKHLIDEMKNIEKGVEIK